MQIKKYQNSPGPISRATDEYYNGTGWHFVKGSLLRPSDPNYSVAQRKGLDKNYLVDKDGVLVPEKVRSAYEQNKLYQAQLPYQEQNDINDTRLIQKQQADRFVALEYSTPHMLNTMILEPTKIATPSLIYGAATTDQAKGFGDRFRYVFNPSNRGFFETNDYTRQAYDQDPVGASILNLAGDIVVPTALVKGALAINTTASRVMPAVKTATNNAVNGVRNYFTSSFGRPTSIVNANQTAVPTTTSGLNLDTDLGEIMGRIRLGLKNTREYYNSEGFAQRMRNAGFTEDEIDLARTEIESILNHQNDKYTGIHVLEGTQSGARGLSVYTHGPNTHYGARTHLHYNRIKSGDQLYNTLFHEYGGHGATANMNSIEFSTQYPMISKMMLYNNKLYLRYTQPSANIRRLAEMSDDGIVKMLSSQNPTKTPEELINFIRKRANHINYLAEPQEVRARAFEEIMTGIPNANNRTGFLIFNEGDWNAYLLQFLKKGGRLFPRKNNIN